MLKNFKRRFSFLNIGMMNNLFWYHIFFALVYYVYSIFARSDSFAYYARSKYNYDDWLSIYENGTQFIDFLTYPFVSWFGFSYEMMMVLFAWMGYWGFIYFYIFFKENLRFTHKFQGIDLLKILLFLPNMHFWTVSLGKGSIIFLGLGLAIYGLSRFSKRKLALIIGMLIVYQVRPHVFLFMGFGIVIGILTGREKIPVIHKLAMFLASVAALIVLYDDIIAFAQLDSENLVESFDNFSDTRAFELSKSGSGMDTSGYPLILKLFTFWFRPLFVDAPGVLGLIVSIENVLYLILAAKLFQRGFFRFLKLSPTVVKTSLIIFITASIALAETLSNLGIIIRQKSMVMYFFFFVILAFMDYKKNTAAPRKKKPIPHRENQNVITNSQPT